MNFKIVVLAFVCVVGISNIHAASPTNLLIQQRAEQAINEQIAKFRAASGTREFESECYPYYDKVFADLFEEFTNDKKKIEEKKAQEHSDLSTEGDEKREEIIKKIQDVSTLLELCESEETNENYFDCVANGGDEGSRIIWTAHRDSLDFAAYIREESHEIDARADKANKEAERKYIVSRAKANDEMLKCFENGLIPSTESPPPTEATTTTEIPEQDQVEELEEK